MTRAALGSMALPLSLVLGMLAAPASCQCGSPLPHDHSLFILGTHTHAVETQSKRHSHASEQAEVTDDGPRNAAEVRADGPSLRAASEYTTGQARTLALLLDTVAIEPAGSGSIRDDAQPATGHSSAPEPPPPQA